MGDAESGPIPSRSHPASRPTQLAPLVQYRSFEYQAAPWHRPRRVIAKVEYHLGELFPRVGFIVTTLTGTNRAVARFYNRRGAAEQWIKKGKAATQPRQSPALAGLAPHHPELVADGLQQQLFKTGGHLIRHAGIHPAAGREPLDEDPLLADSRARKGALLA